MKVIFKKAIILLFYLLAGYSLAILSAYIPAEGIDLLLIKDHDCDIYVRGLPLSFSFVIEDYIKIRPTRCSLPSPAGVPIELVLKRLVIFPIDVLFWVALLYCIYRFHERKYCPTGHKRKTISGIFLSIAITMAGFVLSIPAQTNFKFDLANLRSQNTLFTRAFDIIEIQGAWEFILNSSTTLSSVVVGIVDTGVDGTHQEFKNPQVIFGNTSFTSLIDRRLDGHGTQVAGIIGANNVLGSGGILLNSSPQMNGIASGILKENQYTLEIEKYDKVKTPTTTQIISVFTALENILTRNPKVLNMSFGMPKCSATDLEPVCYKTDLEFVDAFGEYVQIFNASENQDTLFVAAAGNWDINSRLNVLPATIRLTNLMTIGGTDLDDGRATFDPLSGLKSDFGSDIDISAPGVHVYAPNPGDDYDEPLSIGGVLVPLTGFEGTSAAAPMVTGVAAVLKSIRPTSTPVEIKNVLISSADPLFVSSTSPEAEKTLGSGCSGAPPPGQVLRGCRLNSHRAVAWQFPPVSSTLSISTTTADSISLSWNLPNFDFKNPDFDSYQLFRSTSSPVNQSSTIAFSTDATSTLTFADEELSPDTTYFYKLFTFDQAGLSSESNEVSAATQAPTIPDIRGLYMGNATSTLSNCQNPDDNITIAWTVTALNVFSQTNGNFNATGTATALVNSDFLLDNFLLSGSVSDQGSLNGTASNTFFINNVFNSSSQGTFTGQFFNNILSFSFFTQDIIGDTCQEQGTLRAVRQ